jgi:putative toxin-antitoxin system antitoxin component (TIGR02293 family)
MKKDLKSKADYTSAKYRQEMKALNEPEVFYYKSPPEKTIPLPIVEDFTHKKFEKIACKIPFTQKDWSNILHLSERTLQRYAKDNKNFEGIYTDRILHIDRLIDAGLDTFETAEALYRWLHREKNVLGKTLTFESLYTTQGIQNTIDELGRIQHGVYI